MKVIDLYCGLGGWAAGLVSNGFDVTGYDILNFSGYYPGRFIQADILKPIDFPDADAIVASPPCTEFSKASFPPTWKSVVRFPPDIEMAERLFNRVYEIVGLVRPKYYIIENVRGAQKFMGKAKMHAGSRYFWGDFPEFEVQDKSGIYGKYKLPPSSMRPAIRSKIPFSISHEFARKLLEVKA